MVKCRLLFTANFSAFLVKYSCGTTDWIDTYFCHTIFCTTRVYTYQVTLNFALDFKMNNWTHGLPYKLDYCLQAWCCVTNFHVILQKCAAHLMPGCVVGVPGNLTRPQWSSTHSLVHLLPGCIVSVPDNLTRPQWSSTHSLVHLLVCLCYARETADIRVVAYHKELA